MKGVNKVETVMVMTKVIVMILMMRLVAIKRRNQKVL